MEEKGLVFNIQKFSLNDGNGIRTIVFLQGCPLRCRWCSNPESQETEPQLQFSQSKCIGCGTCASKCPSGAIYEGGIRRELCRKCGTCEKFCPTGAVTLSSHWKTVEDVMKEIRKDRVFYENSNGGVTVSGGEPLLQWRFTSALLRQCREEGIDTAIETTCFAQKSHLAEVAENADTVLCDIKHMNDYKHRLYTGVSNKTILDNISYLGSIGKKFIVRIPFITEVNADAENVEATAEFAAKNGASEVHLLPYHRFGEPKYQKLGRTYEFTGTRPADEVLEASRKIFEKYGLKTVVGG